jgi:hypothetical protein
MSRTFAFVSSLVLAGAISSGTHAVAGQNAAASARVVGEAAAALPVVDRFEDEGQTLELLAPAAPYAPGSSVTLVYRNEDAGVSQVTVQPTNLAAGGVPTLDTFLGEMDPAFLSFVRASVADRMIRVKARATELDRVEAALFFPSKRAELVRTDASRSAVQEMEYIPIAVD